MYLSVYPREPDETEEYAMTMTKLYAACVTLMLSPIEYHIRMTELIWMNRNLFGPPQR